MKLEANKEFMGNLLTLGQAKYSNAPIYYLPPV